MENFNFNLNCKVVENLPDVLNQIYLVKKERKRGRKTEIYYEEWIFTADKLGELNCDVYPTKPNPVGEWIRDDQFGAYRCSLCGTTFYRPKEIFNFCPNCGAKMEEEK